MRRIAVVAHRITVVKKHFQIEMRALMPMKTEGVQLRA
jgi:hypothetical protein